MELAYGAETSMDLGDGSRPVQKHWRTCSIILRSQLSIISLNLREKGGDGTNHSRTHSRGPQRAVLRARTAASGRPTEGRPPTARTASEASRERPPSRVPGGFLFSSIPQFHVLTTTVGRGRQPGPSRRAVGGIRPCGPTARTREIFVVCARTRSV